MTGFSGGASGGKMSGQSESSAIGLTYFVIERWVSQSGIRAAHYAFFLARLLYDYRHLTACIGFSAHSYCERGVTWCRYLFIIDRAHTAGPTIIFGIDYRWWSWICSG